MNNRILPQSIDIEMAFIGSLIINPSLMDIYYSKIKPSFFYAQENKAIYLTIKKMYEDEKIIDLLTISEELKAKGKIEEAGTEVYLAELCESIVTERTMPQYFKILAEKSIARNIIIECTKIQELLFNENIEIKSIISKIENIQTESEYDCDFADIERKKNGLIKRFNEYTDRIRKYREEGFQNIGVSPGKEWKQLTNKYRPAKGMLNIFTGIPGHGKSEFVDALMVNLSIEKRWKWAIFSPENWPLELHAQKLIEKVTNQSFFSLNENTFTSALDFINDHFFIIEPDEDNIVIDPILKLFKEAIDKHDIDGCLLDPWNELDNTPEKNENLTAYIGRKLAKIRRFARKETVFFSIIAHPQKMWRDKKTKKYVVPTLYDISDSANWFNKADNGLCIYRNYSTNITDVHVQKIKFKVHGEVGCVSFIYNDISGRYSEYYDDGFGNEELNDSDQEELWQNRSFD